MKYETIDLTLAIAKVNLKKFLKEHPDLEPMQEAITRELNTLKDAERMDFLSSLMGSNLKKLKENLKDLSVKVSQLQRLAEE